MRHIGSNDYTHLADAKRRSETRWKEDFNGKLEGVIYDLFSRIT